MRAAFVVLALVFSSAVVPQEKIKACMDCHGAGGISTTPLTPSLGGQPAFYLIAQLFLFREGRRDNAVMVASAKGLSDDDLRSLSDRISKLPPPPPPKAGKNSEKHLRGKAIVEQRHCTGCHGKDFAGHNNVPRVAHQREDYLAKALKDYRSSSRIGYGTAVMPETVNGLSDAQLEDVAHYLAYLAN
ncbi:MAG TPA: c-type cytochrome [Burkholderiaceae bacterium]|nr:c-type cytochrome [Burkholderiaceae bacterium]